jgi:hypothetical protein
LLKTRRGQHRCGLGDLRPAVCHSFPTELVDGVLCVRPDHGCACREWSLADVDMAEEMEVLEDRQADAEVYCEVVAMWNQRVLEAAPQAEHDFSGFCEFVLAAYDDLAATAATQEAIPAQPAQPAPVEDPA